MSDLDETRIEILKQKYTTKAESNDVEGEYFVWLNIDNQRFRMFEPMEDSKRADWMRRQLAIALSKIIPTNK